MSYCPNCKLKKSRWSTVNGFVIGDKAYCCIGCGFTGCLCIPKPNRKKTPPSPPATVPR